MRRLIILLILAAPVAADTIWITRGSGEPRQIERAVWQASALPAKGWTVTSAPQPPDPAATAAADLAAGIARVRAAIIDAYRERAVLEYIDAAVDKPFGLAPEKAALAARITALRAELAALKTP